MDKKSKAPRKKLRFWQWTLIILAAAVICVALRYVYILFIDPMWAFGDQLASPTPVDVSMASPSSEAPSPSPAQEPVQSASPSPSASAEPTPYTTGKPEPTVPPTEEPTEAVVTAEPTESPELDLSFMSKRVNILIIGWDESPERTVSGSDVYRDEGNNFRSDVIMLLSVNFKSNKVDLISIPRDTLATLYTDEGTKYSETAHWKINAAFAKGGSAGGRGFQYAMQTVSKLFGGIPIQYYAGVNMQGMKAVVDAMGGVDYDVDVHIVLNGRVLEKGFQHLNGQQVLDYCRARKGISTDVGRTDRQQRMLFSIFEQLKSRDQLKNFVNIYNSVRGYIFTNLNTDQIATMATFGMGIDMSDLRRKTLDGEYISSTPYNGASFYCIYNEKLAELIDRVFGVAVTLDPKQDAGYVLADKAAAYAHRLVGGARYLISYTQALGLMDGEIAPAQGTGSGIFGNSSAELSGYSLMLSLADQLEEISVRKPDADLNVPLDLETIESLTARLTAMMSELCVEKGYTRAMLDSAELPSDFYKSLPKQ